MKRVGRLFAASSAMAIGFGLMSAGSAQGQAAAPAQPTAADVDEVVVTGTSIRGVAAVGQPVVGLNQEDIKAIGAANLAQVARTLPVVLNIGPDESRTGGAQDAAANSSRISAINLRGLGPEATLLLWNGRRLAPGGVLRALSDPSMISAGATERIEVVLDGNSAVYGADAVAGVVNIITRRRFDGAETNVRYGEGDGLNEKSLSQTYGRTWSTGDVFIALEAYNRSDLARSARPFLSQDLRPYGGTDQRSTQATTPNIVVGGARLPFPTFVGAPNRYDPIEGDFLPEQRRYNGLLSVRQDVTPDLQVWYEGFFSRRRILTDNPPLGGTFSVPASNPFYVRNVPGVAAGAPLSVEYRLPRAGARTEGKEVAAQSAVGFRYDLPAEWQLNGYVTRSFDSAVTGLGGEQLNNFAVPIALRDTNPATALNVFGGPISDAIYSRIIAFRLQKTDALTHHVEAKLDGPLFTLPAGEVRAAIGAGFDKASFRYQEHQSALSPTNTPSTTNDRKNRREITSVYGELFVPLVSTQNEMPLVKRLDVSLAARFDDYSDFGDTTNPKFALVWEPIDGLSLRGTFGKSFRAPSLVDTGNLNFVFVSNVPDPANGNRLITQVNYTGSNPNLGPEKAKTHSVGFDWRPTSFLRGLSVSATYYKVDYKDRILGIAASLATENQFRQFVTRNPPAATIAALFNSGFLVSTPVDPATVGVLIDQRRNNIGTLEQTGLDIDARYTFDTGLGAFTAGLAHSEIFHIRQQTSPSAARLDVVDTLNNPVGSRGRASLIWRSGGWSANVFYNYGGSYLNTGVVPNVKVKSQKTFDAGVAYATDEGDTLLSGIRVALHAQNVFDEDPPIVINGVSSWDSTTASAIGRFVSVELTKRW